MRCALLWVIIAAVLASSPLATAQEYEDSPITIDLNGADGDQAQVAMAVGGAGTTIRDRKSVV